MKTHDAFVSNDYASLADLPAGAVVGSSSLRRQAQVLARYPHLKVEPLRGNLDTRLGKLDSGQYQAIVLAAAGLKRLGLHSRIRNVIESTDMLPAVGQGALGLEIRAGDSQLAELVKPLIDPVCTALVSAERSVSKALGGSCQVPIAGYATLNDAHFHFARLGGQPGWQDCDREKCAGKPATLGNCRGPGHRRFASRRCAGLD